MVTIKEQEDKLLIEISHPCPEDYLKDLKEAIIEAVQNQCPDGLEPQKLHEVNHTLLELLKNLD